MSDIEREKLLGHILELYAVGYGSGRIARELKPLGFDVSHQTVQTLIGEAAAAMRKRNEQVVDEAWMQQDAAIVKLYAVCCAAMRDDDGAYVFNEKALKCAVLLMERRARLLGLDKQPAARGAGSFSWLDKAAPAELEALARSYGIAVPAPIA